MKTQSNFKSSLVTGAALLFAILSITVSCKKETITPNTGGNTGGSSDPGSNAVFIQSSTFSPSTITVAANTTITWTNKDASTHTVTSNTGVFNSGNMAKNGTFSYLFTTPGTYQYHCTIHAFMTGTVIVN